MILNQQFYDALSPGSHTKIELTCDSRKNPKCLGTFLREKRNAVLQRKRTIDKDYCKFCQKTEEYTGRGNPNTKYFFDDNIFTNIDTPEKAYFIGWVAGDGSISDFGITISIRDYDVEVLKILRAVIDVNIPITELKEDMVSLTINSAAISKDICKHLSLTSTGKKDNLVQFPHTISENLKQYFIRGYFEADGSIFSKNGVPGFNITSNSIQMLEGIKEHYKLGSIYNTQLQSTSGLEALKFFGNIYSDRLDLKLCRKYYKYQDYYNWVPSKTGAKTSIKFNTTQGLIKFNKSKNNAILPTITDIHASGIDLSIVEKIKDFTEDVSLYTTGIKVSPPPGYYFILVGRSSISKSGYSLANGIGIIDENYIGEILVPLRKHTQEELSLPSRLVQLVLMPKINCEFTLVDSLEDTERGTGGFGSTGK